MPRCKLSGGMRAAERRLIEGILQVSPDLGET